VGAAVAGQQAGARTDVRARQFQVASALTGSLAAPAAVDVPAVAMPLDPRFREIGHEVVVELAGRFEIPRAAMGALLRTDVMFDEDGAGRGLGPKEARVFAVLLAAVVGAGAVEVTAAREGAFAALTDLLDVVLQLGQPRTQVRVFRFQLGDPLLERAHKGQDGGLGLRRDRVPEWCTDRRLRNHTPTTMHLYKEFSLGTVVGSRIPRMERRTA
jgi:hypothetical protein